MRPCPTPTLEQYPIASSITETLMIERVSVAIDGASGNNASDRPSITADGNYVVFTSLANNLVEGDTNGV
jgi:hypothetical protein